MTNHPNTLASHLWRARSQGVVVPLSAADCVRSVADAYAVQRGIETLAQMPRAGWKVGATSLEAQRALNADGPMSAPMLAPFCYGSPAEVTVFAGHDNNVECEFAFRFSRGLPPRRSGYAMKEVTDAIDALLPAIEVVGSRFEGGLAGIGQLRLAADMTAHTAFVHGAAASGWRGLALDSQGVTLYKNGEPVREGSGANVLGGPLHVLRWTVNHLCGMGEPIEAGQVVTTGTCTGLTPAAHGDLFTADFGALGKVETRILES